MVVTAFEIGDDTGDSAGELQAWATDIPTTLPFPAGDRPLRYDVKRKMLVLSTGVGTNRAAVSTMALGNDPRFDVSHAYWMVAAIAGVNPNEASIGSGAWIGDVVDTDLGYLIDMREIPASWSTGYIPYTRQEPYQLPVPADRSGNYFPLNKGLRDWAFDLTAAIPLADSVTLKQIRSGYTRYPKALTPPQVIKGDEATGQVFWHGKMLNDHVERWTRYWTNDEGRFVMTAMEDSGVYRAIAALQASGKADLSRLLVLRTGSNYSVPPAGKSAAQSMQDETNGLSGLQSSLDAAHLLGNHIVNEISANWSKYRDAVPGKSEH